MRVLLYQKDVEMGTSFISLGFSFLTHKLIIKSVGFEHEDFYTFKSGLLRSNLHTIKFTALDTEFKF